MYQDGEDVSTVSIVPYANVGLSNWSRASLNGNVDGNAFPVNTDDVFAVTAFVSDNPDGDSTPYFHNASVNCNEQGICLFSPNKYYSPNKIHYFYAYSPVKYGNPVYNDLSKDNRLPTVTFSIDGQQDIMWAKDDSGIIVAKGSETQQHPKLQFKHLLKKIRFKFIQGVGFASNIDVTTVRIVNLHEHLSLNLKTGVLKAEGDQTGTVEIHGTWAINPKDISVELPNLCLMCEPGDIISIEIFANQYKYEIKDLKLASDTDGIEPGGAGVSHLITVEFHATHIEPSSQITSFEEIEGEASGNI